MVKVKFIEDVHVALVSAPDVEFAAGKVYELPDASAHRWERRGKAVRVESKPAK